MGLKLAGVTEQPAEVFTQKCAAGSTLSPFDFSGKKIEGESTARTMKKAKTQTAEYPDETSGSRLAAKARRLANPQSPEERREFIAKGLNLIDAGASPQQANRPRH